jgi:ubiquinone/menaquinone biosynthesis C-methylase UbiE
VASSLADLRLVNRWFGGAATTYAMVHHVSQQRGLSSLSLLEVAAGSGDVPKYTQQKLQQRGIAVKLTFLDRSRIHMNGNARCVAADALALPFRNNSFDLVSCGLFTHHLAPGEVTAFAREALRVCRAAVVINDLIRDPVHLALVYAGYPLYRSRLTRHDGPASVRAAYTPTEIRSLLRNTGAKQIEITRHYLFRMGVIAWK